MKLSEKTVRLEVGKKSGAAMAAAGLCLGVAVAAGALWAPGPKSAVALPESGPDSAAPPENKGSRLAFLRPELEAALTKMDAELKKPQPRVTTRDFPNAALAALVLQNDVPRAEGYLRRLLAEQDAAPASPEYGTIPWRTNSPEVRDPNAVVFSSQALGPILLGWGGRLSPAMRGELAARAPAFFASLRRRQMRTPAYTNIWLMRAVNLALLGDAVGDRSAADEGLRQLREWVAWTRANGVSEFNSPTYAAVQINTLTVAWRYGRDPDLRKIARAGLDYLWTDLAANYFAGRGSYAGPHSRDYDFPGGWGGGAGYYYLSEGLADDGTSHMINFERLYPYLNARDGGYRPSKEILALARLPEKIVTSRHKAGSEGHDRYLYVTPQFALGAAGRGYSSQDKMIAVELASRKKLPVISVVPDVWDAPYGAVKSTDRTGHSKAWHPPVDVTYAQNKGALLALMDIDPSGGGRPPEGLGARGLATNVLLPAKADCLLLDNTKVTANAPFRASYPLGTGVVGILEGSVGVAVRIIAADGAAGAAPPAWLQADAEGLALGAARLTVYHRPVPGGGIADVASLDPVRVGLLILAAPCKDDAALRRLMARARDARIENTGAATGLWSVAATIKGADGAGNTSRLEASREAGRGPQKRRVNGREQPTDTLSVNGRDLAGPIWAQLPPEPLAATNLSKNE